MEWLTEPFATGFMQRAWLAIVLGGATCAWLGVHITLRRMAFFSEALAHATLPGVVVAHVLGLHLLLGALASALAAVAGVAWSANSKRTNTDSAIGVSYTGFFALGVIGLTQVGGYQDLAHLLVGNPMGVQADDLWVIGGCALVVCAMLLVSHRLLATTMIDPDHARAVGYPVALARTLVLVLAAMTVVTALSAVGLVLAVALVITPAAIARLLCRRLGTTIAVAVSIAVLAGSAGLNIAYHWNWPAGATVVVLLSTLYGLTRLIGGQVGSHRHKIKPPATGAPGPESGSMPG